MAITNASDLLVYAKTANPVTQVTRIYVKTTNPITLEDGETTGKLTVSNITNSSGVIFDGVETAAASNTAASVLSQIAEVLTGATGNKGYSSTSIATSGDYSYRDFTNGNSGIVPTLQITDGTTSPKATLTEDAVIIEIVTPGSSAVYDPVAFSTSASFSQTVDTIDCTNKDSGGNAQYKAGLKSFEISTELLQSTNPDVPLDGTDFFHELSERDQVNLAFSDRIRNIILTNLTTSGVDGFTTTSGTQTTGQTDPFSGTTASKFQTAASTNNKYLAYNIAATRLEDKKINWSFYVKGSGSTTQASFAISNSTIGAASTVTKLEGSGTIAHITGPYYKITGLSTSEFTRISFSTTTITGLGATNLSLYLYPGLYSAQDSDAIITSSWQIELVPDATNYQDPTTITQYQGNAFVTSVNFDAGVEDNVTCSATFTGTGVTVLNQ